MEVPAGSVSCSMAIYPTQHPKSPVIVYQQNQRHTCIFSSTTSALHNYGMKEYAKYINNFSTSSLQESNTVKFFLQDVIRRSPRPFNAKMPKKRELHGRQLITSTYMLHSWEIKLKIAHIPLLYTMAGFLIQTYIMP